MIAEDALNVPPFVQAAGRDIAYACGAFLGGVQSRSTRMSYRSYLLRFLAWAQDTKYPLAELLGRRVASGDLLDAGYTSDRRRTTYTVTVLNGLRRHLPPPPREVLRWAAADGLGPLGDEVEPEDLHAALVMLTPVYASTMDPAAVSEFTGVDLETVEELVGRLRANGIWQNDGKIHGDWLDDEYGGLAFLLDVWTATGLLERQPDDGAEGPHAGGEGHDR